MDEIIRNVLIEFDNKFEFLKKYGGASYSPAQELPSIKSWLEAALREVYLKGVKRGQSPDGIMLKKQGTI